LTWLDVNTVAFEAGICSPLWRNAEQVLRLQAVFGGGALYPHSQLAYPDFFLISPLSKFQGRIKNKEWV